MINPKESFTKIKLIKDNPSIPIITYSYNNKKHKCYIHSMERMNLYYKR